MCVCLFLQFSAKTRNTLWELRVSDAKICCERRGIELSHAFKCHMWQQWIRCELKLWLVCVAGSWLHINDVHYSNLHEKSIRTFTFFSFFLSLFLGHSISFVAMMIFVLLFVFRSQYIIGTCLLWACVLMHWENTYTAVFASLSSIGEISTEYLA